MQNYYSDPLHHDMIYQRWETVLRLSIGDLVRKRRLYEKKNRFYWDGRLEHDAQDLGGGASPKEEQTQFPEVFLKPRWPRLPSSSSGAKSHIRVAHEMALEAGGVAPPKVVRKTHTRKDGTVIDKRAGALVKKAEDLALERSKQSTVSDGTSASSPSSQELDAAYIETAKKIKGSVYGLGSIQFLDASPNETADASLLRHVETDARMTKMD